jgi:hypothetical protein
VNSEHDVELNTMPSFPVVPSEEEWAAMSDMEKRYFHYQSNKHREQKDLMTFGQMMANRNDRQKDKDAIEVPVREVKEVTNN